MNIKRWIIASLVIWVVSFVFGMLTCGWLFTWVYEIPPLIWQDIESMTSGSTFAISIGSGLLSALLFTLVFAVLYKGIPGKGVKKGLLYGLLIWIVGPLIGMWTMPVYMTIAWAVVLYWILQSLVLNLINGLIIGAIYKPK